MRQYGWDVQVAQKAQAQAQAQAAPAQCALVMKKVVLGFFVNLYKKDRDDLIIRRAWEDLVFSCWNKFHETWKLQVCSWNKWQWAFRFFDKQLVRKSSQSQEAFRVERSAFWAAVSGLKTSKCGCVFMSRHIFKTDENENISKWLIPLGNIYIWTWYKLIINALIIIYKDLLLFGMTISSYFQQALLPPWRSQVSPGMARWLALKIPEAIWNFLR